VQCQVWPKKLTDLARLLLKRSFIALTVDNFRPQEGHNMYQLTTAASATRHVSGCQAHTSAHHA
jgi:hypothetical protein